MDMDFGYSQTESSENTTSANVNDTNNTSVDINTGDVNNTVNGESVDDINSISHNDNTTTSTDVKNVEPNAKEDTNNDDIKSKLVEGATIEVGDETYTIDKDGNAIDKNGNIFKEAKNVDAWINEFDEVTDTDDNTNISINSIRDAIGIDITDEQGKSVEFDNTTDGIKNYVNAVIENAKAEQTEIAINTLCQKYPIVKDVLSYYIANGNSLEGFNQIPDRSNITIDDSNEAQQEQIIRVAWNERGQKGDVESYIGYLKSSGILLATAKEELAALQEADAQYRKQIEDEAERKENERIEELEKYWNGVHDVIKKREIAGYQIPEQIIINRNGQKLSVTPEDFFNYLYRVDKKGYSAYQYDLAKETPESRRDDEILRAYLKFVGGNYSNLVSMAINKEKVNALKLKAKTRTKSSSIRITSPIKDKKDNNIDLGYN